MRWMVIVSVLAAVLASAGGAYCDESNGPAAVPEEQRVLAAEDAYVAAEVNRDESALRKLVDDRFVYNAADGTTSGKEDLIRGVLAMNMTGQKISERSVIIEGAVAVIFGTTELQFQASGGEPRTSTLRYTSVYVKRSGEWRMLGLQMQPHSSRQAGE